jgi:hypothetical protein
MDLIQEIIKAAGVNEAQAKGGAGLLFKMAQDKLASGDFASLTKALPQVTDLIKAAPSSGGGLMGAFSSVLGGGSLGGLASIAGALTSLKMDPQTLGKFVPVILDVVKQKAGPELAAALAKLIPVK